MGKGRADARMGEAMSECAVGKRLKAVHDALQAQAHESERGSIAAGLYEDYTLIARRDIEIHRQSCSACQPGPGEASE